MDERKSSGIGIHARRVLAYIVLIFISILCLFWFYVLFVNATRSHAQIQLGFSALPSGEFMNNWVHLMHSSQPVWNGLFNSVIIAAFSSILTTYFSCMTAYAIHVYNFKLKNVMFTFILMIMMIPTQVTALGFYRLMMDWNLMDSFIPLIVPAIAAPVVFFYMKQYMDSSLPLEIVEASRIDGAGEFKTFNMMILPIMKPAIAVQAIFAFVQSWNNYFIPSLLLTENKKKTLPIFRLARFLRRLPEHFLREVDAHHLIAQLLQGQCQAARAARALAHLRIARDAVSRHHPGIHIRPCAIMHVVHQRVVNFRKSCIHSFPCLIICFFRASYRRFCPLPSRTDQPSRRRGVFLSVRGLPPSHTCGGACRAGAKVVAFSALLSHINNLQCCRGFASAEATRGLSVRPLDPFGFPFIAGCYSV